MNISEFVYAGDKAMEIEDSVEMWSLNPFSKEKLTDAHVYHTKYPVYAEVESLRLVFKREKPEGKEIISYKKIDLKQ